jgi:hypothetical protein
MGSLWEFETHKKHPVLSPLCKILAVLWVIPFTPSVLLIVIGMENYWIMIISAWVLTGIGLVTILTIWR